MIMSVSRPNGAMLWVEDFILGAADRFHAALAALPQWEESLNSQVKEYCDGLARAVRDNAAMMTGASRLRGISATKASR